MILHNTSPRVPASHSGYLRPRLTRLSTHSRARRLRIEDQLASLNNATKPEDMNLPGWDWHPPKSNLAGHWAVSVSGNWRLTFSFEGSDAILVDYEDYH